MIYIMNSVQSSELVLKLKKDAPEESRRLHLQKYYENNYEDENNSLKNVNKSKDVMCMF